MLDRERFRMTTWPNQLPVVSEVTGFSPYRLDGDLLKLDLDAGMTTHEIPDELYLRELYELDTGDIDQVLGFMNTYGRLGHPAQPVRRSDTGKVVISSERAVIRELGVDVPKLRDLPWEDWWAEVDSGVGEMGDAEKGMFFSDGMLHLEAFRGWALAFKRLTRLYLDFGRGRTSDMEKLARVLTDLMTPFTPVLDMVIDEKAEDWSPFRGTFLAPRLENVLALQMFNHLAAEHIYHVCGNETHGGLFVHQRGRAESGQHRSIGVKFCSTKCARSQASRDYRRRQRAKDTKEA